MSNIYIFCKEAKDNTAMLAVFAKHDPHMELHTSPIGETLVTMPFIPSGEGKSM